jgi:hypothetical protein
VVVADLFSRGPKQTNNKKGVSRKKQLCDSNAAKRTKEAEEAARSKLEMVCPRSSGVLSWGQIVKDIDTFIANCTVRPLRLSR